MDVDMVDYVPFLALAFAINLLQLWDGVKEWIVRRSNRPIGSNQNLAARRQST